MASKDSPGGIAAGAATGAGELVIRETVLEEIAYAEAMGTPGVVAPREGLVRGILRGKRPRGVLVETAASEVAFHLTLGVREGVRMPDAAAEVRRRVAEAVRTKTGYGVRAVNVSIDHIVFDKDS